MKTIEISELALRTANSIMPFVLHPPSSNHTDEVRDNIARSIDYAIKKGRVGWLKATKTTLAAPDLLEALQEAKSLVERICIACNLDRDKFKEYSVITEAIKKATP